MTARQKRIAIVGTFVAVVISAVPTVLLLKYGWQVLPVLDLKSKLPFSTKPEPRLPFSLTFGLDNKISTQLAEELDETKKVFINEGLSLLFGAYAGNLAYYFPYFTVVESSGQHGLFPIVLVFSKELPEAKIINGIKQVNWNGRRIFFDILNRRMMYVDVAEDSGFEFKDYESLTVTAYYSGTLQPKSIQPRIQPETGPKSERL